MPASAAPENSGSGDRNASPLLKIIGGTDARMENRWRSEILARPQFSV
jgi:hypothetical protein